MTRQWRRAILSRLALRFPWMVRLLPAAVPVAMRRYPCADVEPARSLIVFLPGIGDTAEAYDRHGFIDAVKQQGRPADMIVVDAHYGYYASQTILDRLHGDVFEPAKALGYQHRWLVGISLGGFGALLYASRHRSDVTGVVAMAPYLGRPAMIDEIVTAGGIRQWNPGRMAQDDYERHVWSWLKGYGREASRLPALCLAYGKHDCFVPAHRVLSQMLSPQQVFVESGGHDWRTWKKLWTQVLMSSIWRQETARFRVGAACRGQATDTA